MQVVSEMNCISSDSFELFLLLGRILKKMTQIVTPDMSECLIITRFSVPGASCFYSLLLLGKEDLEGPSMARQSSILRRLMG